MRAAERAEIFERDCRALQYMIKLRERQGFRACAWGALRTAFFTVAFVAIFLLLMKG